MSKQHHGTSPSTTRSNEPVYEETGEDKFLFVNRDSTTISQGTRSREVSTHVQSSHRKLSPGTVMNPAKQFSSIEHPKPSVAPKRRGEIQPWRVDRPVSTEENSMSMEPNTEAGQDRAPFHNASPTPMGNSDPFSALPFPVDPVTNRILSWCRDDGIAGLFPLEKAITGSIEPLARATWKRVINSLQSPSLAQPHLAPICAYMAWQTKSDVIREFTFQLKGKAYSILRDQIAREDETNRDDTRRMMLDLFWVEQTTESHAAAETHLSPLIKSLEDYQPSQISSECRLELLSADNSLAVSQMTIPLLNGRDWVIEGMHEEGKLLFEDVDNQRLKQGALELDAAVTDTKLRSILMVTKGVVTCVELALIRKVRDYTVIQQLQLRLQSCVSGLLTLSCEHEDQHHHGSTGGLPPPQSSLLDHCACLTALAWLFAVGPTKTRCTRQGLADQLESAQRRCGFVQSDHTDAWRLELWSFYVGSLLEHKIEIEIGKQPGRGWYANMFEQIKRKLEQERGLDVSETLSKFLHSDALSELSLVET